MKLAISNIAWDRSDEIAVAAILQQAGIGGVEIAPTKVWRSPLTATEADIGNYRRFWERQGIQVVALQSLLFGRPDLAIFENAQKRQETFDYLAGMIRLGARLGARALVFGSPQNRRVGNLPAAQIAETATGFFRKLGELALENGTALCIEPNPVAYQCDFVTTIQEGTELVSAVGNAGFGLHLDSGGMALSRESFEAAIEKSFQWVRHFHISEPYLARIGSGGVDHGACAKALSRLGYQNWVSIEMKVQNAGSCLKHVEQALARALDFYGAG